MTAQAPSDPFEGLIKRPAGPMPDVEQTTMFIVRRRGDASTRESFYAKPEATETVVWLFGLERKPVRFISEAFDLLFEPVTDKPPGERAMKLREVQAALRDPRFKGDAPVFIRVVDIGNDRGDGAWVSREFPITSGLTGWEDGHITLLAYGELGDA